jgi:hypothetical protein
MQAFLKLERVVRELRDGDFGIQVNVLDCIHECDAVFPRFLESFASENQTHAASAFINESGFDGFGKIGVALRFAARVNERNLAHVAVRDLVTAKIDRVIGRELRVNEWVRLTVLGCQVAAVVGRKLLLDDVGLKRNAQVVGLTGEIGRGVVVHAIDFEPVVAEDRAHAELVGLLECDADVVKLASAFSGSPIHGCADGDCAHVVSLFDGRKHGLVVLVRHAQKFVVINLQDEGDFVRVLAGVKTENTQGAGDAVGAAFDGELDDVFRIEEQRVRRERSAGRVFDALIDWENRSVTGASKATVIQKLLKAFQDRHRAIRVRHEVGNPVWACRVNLLFGDSFAAMLHQRASFISQKFFKIECHWNLSSSSVGVVSGNVGVLCASN